MNTTMIIQRSRWDDGKKLKVFENFDYSPINISWNSAGNVYRLAFEFNCCQPLGNYLNTVIDDEQSRIKDKQGTIVPKFHRVLISNNGIHVVAEHMLVTRKITDYGIFFEMESVLSNVHETSANAEMLLFMTEEEEIECYGE